MILQLSDTEDTGRKCTILVVSVLLESDKTLVG
jgi:hypothetical protein